MMLAIRSSPARQRGVALVMVLWITASAALLVGAFNTTVRSSASVAFAEANTLKARAALDAGIALAAANILPAQAGKSWPLDGRAVIRNFAGHRLEIHIQDIAGKLNINRARPALIRALVRHLTGSKRLADRIAASIETEQRAATRRGEQFAFLHITELQNLPAIDDRTYALLKPHVTAHGMAGRISVLAASKIALASLPGITADQASRAIAARARTASPAEAAEIRELLEAAPELLSDSHGNVFTVTVRAAAQDGNMTLAQEATIILGADDDAPYRTVARQPVAPASLNGM